MKKLEVAAQKFKIKLNQIFPTNEKRPFASAIVTAAGSGTRMGGVSKQLLALNGIPCVAYSLITFEACLLIDEIIIVAKAEEIDEMRSVCDRYHISKVKGIVPGGSTRQESVFNGFRAISKSSKLVAIHDGARPLIEPSDVEILLKKAARFGASCAATKVSDTVKRGKKDGFILETVPRDDLYTVQTPQVFATDLYRISLSFAEKNKISVTDDCALAEEAGFSVLLCELGKQNIKLTTPCDISIAESILKERKNG